MVGLHIVDGDLERLRDQVDWVGEDLGGLEAGVVGRVASGVPGARACGACAAASGAVGDWLSGLGGPVRGRVGRGAGHGGCLPGR